MARIFQSYLFVSFPFNSSDINGVAIVELDLDDSRVTKFCVVFESIITFVTCSLIPLDPFLVTSN